LTIIAAVPYIGSFMFPMLASLAAVVSLLQVPPAADAAPTMSQLRARLTAYEAQVAAGKANASELESIAADTIWELTGSADPVTLVQACSSTFARDAECRAKLWALARKAGASRPHRVEAAAVLARRKDADAAPYLLQLVSGLPPAQLAPLAGALTAVPVEKSVPLLRRLLESDAAAAQEAACRVLREIDTGASREAIQAFLANAPRGTSAWNACTIAAAKLGDPAAQRLTTFISMHLAGDQLIDAADIMMDTDRDRAVSVLMQVTRESRGYPQFEAADRLANIRPEITTDIMEFGLGSDRPEMVAAALELHRSLRLDPNPPIRARMVDANPLVRLRAAETTLAAARRARAG
jgi:hypothetical protein